MVSLTKAKLMATHVLTKLREQEKSWLTPRGLRVREVVSDIGANLVAAISRGHLTHIPCLAHILNLVVQKFLSTYQGMGNFLEVAQKNVHHFRHSPDASATLAHLQKHIGLPRHRLILDVPTRWNSTLAMSERLVEQRKAVSKYMVDATVASTTNLPLIILNANWAHLQKVCLVLAPFLQATNMVSRDHALVCEWVPLVCLLVRALFGLLEEGKAALAQLDQQAAAQSTSLGEEGEKEEEEDLQLLEEELEVPDLGACEGDQQSAAAVVRG